MLHRPVTLEAMSKPLTPQQRGVIEAMLSRAPLFDGTIPDPGQREQWLAVLDRLTYGGPCDCGGCPSFAIHLDGQPVAEEVGRTVLSAEAPGSMLILFIDRNLPSYLEIAPVEDHPVGLPVPEQMRF